MTQKINEIIEALFDMRVTLDEETKLHVEQMVEKLYIQFATDHLPVFLQQFDISGIVENEINDFNTQEVENLIFKIVDKELTAITWFGALLGMIMGTVSIFF